MSRAVVVEQFGGPEVLVVKDRDPLTPGAGQALVSVTAIGVNYIDIYHRIGMYPNKLPFTPGSEGAGTVKAVGPDVTSVSVGDQVRWDNKSSASEGHTVTGDGLDSGTLKKGDSYTFKFKKAGTFTYSCTVHGFTGKVVVKPHS